MAATLPVRADAPRCSSRCHGLVLCTVSDRGPVMADTERQYYPTGVGDIGLLDSARPSTRLSEIGAQWLSIYPPRQSLIPHLGFEPQACLRGSGETLAARVLRQLVL